MALNLKTIISKRIPTILGISFLLFGVVGGVVLVGQRQGLLLRASPTSLPKQVKITNVSDRSFVVSWITDTNVVGYVMYGDKENEIKGRKGDSRDQKSGSVGSFTTHFVEIDGLNPNTSYYFKVGSGSEEYDNSGSPFMVKTAPVASAVPAADTINGKVLSPLGQGAPAALVYVTFEGAAEMAAITSQLGNWTLTLSNARTVDLSGYSAYDKENTKLTIFVQGGDLGTATATTLTKNDTPVTDITLGQNHDFTANASATSLEASGSADLANTIVIKDNQLSVSSLSVAPGTAITVVNQDAVPHALTAVKKEFDSGAIAAGGTGTVIVPLTPGEYDFADSSLPTIETLKGKFIVQSSNKEATTTPNNQLALNEPEVATVGGFGGMLEPTPTIDANAAVKLLNPGKDGTNIATASPEIKIKGPRGTQIKISVHSAVLQTETLTLDDDGLIGWTPPKDLEPGEHTVTIEYEDEAGVMQKIVRSFTVKAAESEITTFTDSDEPATGIGGSTPGYQATKAATPKPTKIATRSAMPSTQSGIPEAGTMSTTMMLLGLGALLFFGGLAWQVRPHQTSY